MSNIIIRIILKLNNCALVCFELNLTKLKSLCGYTYFNGVLLGVYTLQL